MFIEGLLGILALSLVLFLASGVVAYLLFGKS